MTLCALGKAMANVAAAYSALGRHQDALVMKEKTLEFQRRVLPENHPDIGISCLNLGMSCHKVGDLPRALQFAREALRIFQATLPPSHPHVKQAQQFVRGCEGDIARRS
jgi:tetratricopeptide (TPR) repeat protein